MVVDRLKVALSVGECGTHPLITDYKDGVRVIMTVGIGRGSDLHFMYGVESNHNFYNRALFTLNSE